ncbi:MAG: (2Fe-2S)-binding protein [Burkholderiales bacterium]|jgi:bacterioferritin-associated ferredoxin|nr:(2Fe-2S)-binding protein [Burkholderiales bacterium]MBP6249941.1 (2Fe-2S)-binding protein [Leptothrix sp. (in: b-proteobacteria)]MBP7520936.1 (2Fe-2S)-binding protein [Leptothrix sp. (in: b-proteobacteria)]HQY08289.1 (2Fe-2S)-binding protein [Burkholderiaceae bacterium]
MIVCLCQRISDRDIHAAVRSGAQQFEALQSQTGVASRCGRCHDCARSVFQEALGSPCAAQQAAGCGGCHPLYVQAA